MKTALLSVQLIALALVAGCDLMPRRQPEPIVVVQKVEVPVPVPCKVKWPTRPVSIQLGKAPKPEGLYLQSQGALKELEEERAYRRLLEIALEGCQKLPVPQGPPME